MAGFASRGGVRLPGFIKIESFRLLNISALRGWKSTRRQMRRDLHAVLARICGFSS